VDARLWVANKEQREPFLHTTIINAGGISKTVVGFCLMRAVEEKRLQLDEDINTYLPFKVVNPFFLNEPITLRQLASHTSSIIDRPELYDTTYNFNGKPVERLGDFVKNYLDPSGKYYKQTNYLNQKPGKVFRYSNIATALAADVIEIATGESFNQYSKRVLFDRLNMTSTGWLLSEIDLSKHSHLYKVKNDTITEFQLYEFPTYPDGALRTSIYDLSKFFISVVNEGEYKGIKVLKKEIALEMLKPLFTSSNKPENLDLEKKNYGVFMPIWVKENRVGNAGGDFGVINKMLYNRTSKVGVILFANTSLDAEGNKIFDTIFEELWRYAEEITKKR
jgi:CubicO group peptidase (beta-lactamase class C family)